MLHWSQLNYIRSRTGRDKDKRGQNTRTVGPSEPNSSHDVAPLNRRQLLDAACRVLSVKEWTFKIKLKKKDGRVERQDVDSKIESAGEQAAGVFHTHVSSCTCQGPERTTRLCNLPPAGVWLAALTALSDQSAGEEQWEKGLRTVTRELQVGFALAPGARSAIWAVGRPCKLAAGLLRSPCSGTGLPYRALQLGRQNPSPRKPGFGMRLAKKKKLTTVSVSHKGFWKLWMLKSITC